MQYITHRGYSGAFLSGDGIVSIPYRTNVERKNGVIIYDEKIICKHSSLACHQHFSRNNDQKGIVFEFEFYRQI